MTRQLSIKKSAEICGISIRTSFMWRHKILDALRNSDKTELKGVIEADEAFFRVSYKGNRGFEFLDRMPRRRGSSMFEKRKRGASDEQVNVPCAIERETKSSISKVGGLAKTSRKINVFSNKFKKESILCTDKEASYIKFAKSYELEHIQFENFVSKKIIYHIQTINSFHTRLKRFIDQFYGVSTKHLNNYLIWNSVISEGSSRNSESSIIDKTWSRVLRTVGHTLYKDVCSRPSIPV